MPPRRRTTPKPSHPLTRIERSAGGVVWRNTSTGPEFLAILNPEQEWGIPKGHVEAGETNEQAARREIAEETGLTELRLTAPLPTTDYWFEDRWVHTGYRIHKFVTYFLYELVEHQPVVTSEEEHITDHRWVSAAELPSFFTYKSLEPVVAEALRVLSAIDH